MTDRPFDDYEDTDAEQEVRLQEASLQHVPSDRKLIGSRASEKANLIPLSGKKEERDGLIAVGGSIRDNLGEMLEKLRERGEGSEVLLVSELEAIHTAFDSLWWYFRNKAK
jgi:hypothetical protein